MNIGVYVPLPAYSVDVAPMARKAEELGFESIWCAEHPIMPVHTTSPFPGSADGVIPPVYAHFVDPFVALAIAAGATSTIKLGTGIILVPERNPLVMAKEVSYVRPLQRRAIHLRHRRRLAAGGNGDHGRRLRSPLDPDKRGHTRDEGALDPTRSRVPWSLLRLPAGAGLPQARAEASSAHHAGGVWPRTYCGG